MAYLGKKLASPFSLARRVIWKLFIAPVKYKGQEGYDAEKYWSDRHEQFGLGYRGSGDEGLSEADNEEIYRAEVEGFDKLAERHRVDLAGKHVLDIGCGAGVYAGLCKARGVASYTGVDVTDVLFDELRDKYPGFTFIKANAATGDLVVPEREQFDVVTCISVIIHITRPNQLSTLLANCLRLLDPAGTFFLSPVVMQDKKHYFYNSSWSIGTVVRNLRSHQFSLESFRGGDMLVIRKNPH